MHICMCAAVCGLKLGWSHATQWWIIIVAMKTRVHLCAQEFLHTNIAVVFSHAQWSSPIFHYTLNDKDISPKIIMCDMVKYVHVCTCTYGIYTVHICMVCKLIHVLLKKCMVHVHVCAKFHDFVQSSIIRMWLQKFISTIYDTYRLSRATILQDNPKRVLMSTKVTTGLTQGFGTCTKMSRLWQVCRHTLKWLLFAGTFLATL